MSGTARVLFIIALVVMLVGLGYIVYYSEIRNQKAGLAPTETNEVQLAADLENPEVWDSSQSIQIEAEFMVQQGLMVGTQKVSGGIYPPTFTPILYDEPTKTSPPPKEPTITTAYCDDTTPILAPADWQPGVIIQDGRCCVGGLSGEKIPVSVQFLPEQTKLDEPAVEMRVVTNRGAGTIGVLEKIVCSPWEPMVAEKVYSVYVGLNWTSFWLFVQYRTSEGVMSAVYGDDIAVEGMAGTGTP